MADSKISAMTAATTASGADEFPLVQGGVNKAISFTNLKAALAFLLPASNLSDLISASTARTNLGLGTAATQTTGTFLQTANNLSDVTAATARNNLGVGPAMLSWRSGQYYSHPLETSAASTFTMAANTIYCVPIYVPNVTVTEIGISVTTNAASGKVLSLGIYTDVGGAPGTRLVDSGDLAADAIAVKTATISQALNGWYWLCAQSNGTPIVQSSVLTTRSIGLGMTASNGTPTTAFTRALTYAPFLSTFGAVTDSTGTSLPKIWLRF